MNILQVADLHFTALARDAYRWRLFPWLRYAIERLNVSMLLILGDLTEAKDYHSARLVNQLVDELCRLKRESDLVRITIVPGNHDGIDPGCPYFRFLGQFPFIRYIPSPFMEPISGKQVLFLPHTKTPEEWDRKLLSDADVIFMHQTVSGAVSETGHPLEGMAAASLAVARRAKIWSGDVHVPQVVRAGKVEVEYVGSPYPVRFGDSFKPRAVLLSEGFRKQTDLEPPRFGRHSIRLAGSDLIQLSSNVDLQEGDQVKVRVLLTRSQFGEWGKHKRTVMDVCKAKGVELCGLEVERLEEKAPKIKPRGSGTAALTPAQVLSGWCERQSIAKPLAEAGQRLLASVTK